MSAITFPHETRLTTSAGEVSVTVDLSNWSEGNESLYFMYAGSRAALIECGALSADLMAPQQRGRRRVDEDGDSYDRQHYKHRTTVERYKRLDSPTLPTLPGYLVGMIPAAQDALAVMRAREEQREREEQRKREEEAERNKPRPLEPEEWRQRVARHINVGGFMDYMLRKDAGNSTDGLAAGYRPRECDVLAILDRAHKAEAELTQLIGAMRIDRVNSPLRLVVSNA